MSVYRLSAGTAISYASFIASTTNRVQTDFLYATNGYPWRIRTEGYVLRGPVRTTAISRKVWANGGLLARWYFDGANVINVRQLEYLRDTFFADGVPSAPVTVMTDSKGNISNAGANRDWVVMRAEAVQTPESEWRIINGKIQNYGLTFYASGFLSS